MPGPGVPALEELFRTMQQGVVYHDAAGRVSAANPAACRVLGLEPDALMGRAPRPEGWRLLREDGTPLPEAEEPWRIALGTGLPVRGVVLGVRGGAPSSTRWVLVTAVAEFLPGATAPHRVYVTYDDITERQVQARVQAAQLRIRALDARATLVELLRATVDEAERLTGSERGFVCLLEGDPPAPSAGTWSSRALEAIGPTGPARPPPFAPEDAAAEVIRERRPVVRESGPGEGPRPARELVAPVVRAGAVRAVLGVAEKAGRYDEGDVKLVTALIDAAWDVLDRRRALSPASCSPSRGASRCGPRSST
ncbi:MAG: GAF domain-containing protein [Anaeromyxobacter sp.]